MRLAFLAAALAATAASSAGADVRITEFLQTGLAGADREFFELTNLGDSAVTIGGWSYNDSTASDPVNFSGLGVGSIGAGESIVFTEVSAATFRSYWGLASNVQVFSYGGNSNLGSSGDQINIYSSATQSPATLVDGITFGQGTNGVTKNRPTGVTGAVAGTSFVLSAAGDAFSSHYAGAAGGSDLGNPGLYPAAATAAVPEPASWATLVAGFALAGASLRRRRALVQAI